MSVKSSSMRSSIPNGHYSIAPAAAAVASVTAPPGGGGAPRQAEPPQGTTRTRSTWKQSGLTQALRSPLPFKSVPSSLRRGVHNRVTDATNGVSRRITNTTASLWRASSSIPQKLGAAKKNNTKTSTMAKNNTTDKKMVRSMNFVTGTWNENTDNDDEKSYSTGSSLGRVDAESWSLPPYGDGSETTNTTTYTSNDRYGVVRGATPRVQQQEQVPPPRRVTRSTVPQENWDYHHAGMDDDYQAPTLDDRDENENEKNRNVVALSSKRLDWSDSLGSASATSSQRMLLSSSSLVVDQIMEGSLSCSENDNQGAATATAAAAIPKTMAQVHNKNKYNDRAKPPATPRTKIGCVPPRPPPPPVAATTLTRATTRHGSRKTPPPVAWITCLHNDEVRLGTSKHMTDKNKNHHLLQDNKEEKRDDVTSTYSGSAMMDSCRVEV